MLIETQSLINAVILRVYDLGQHTHMAPAIAEEFICMRGLQHTVSFRHDRNLLEEVRSGEHDNDIEDAWLIIMDTPETI